MNKKQAQKVNSLTITVDCVDKMVQPTIIEEQPEPYFVREDDCYGVTHLNDEFFGEDVIERVNSNTLKNEFASVESATTKDGTLLVTVNQEGEDGEGPHIFTQLLLKPTGALFIQHQIAGGGAAFGTDAEAVKVVNVRNKKGEVIDHAIRANFPRKYLKKIIVEHIQHCLNKAAIKTEDIKKLKRININLNTHSMCGWLGEQDTTADKAFQQFGGNSAQFHFAEECALGGFVSTAVSHWKDIWRSALDNEKVMFSVLGKYRPDKALEMGYTFDVL